MFLCFFLSPLLYACVCVCVNVLVAYRAYSYGDFIFFLSSLAVVGVL